MHVRFSPWALDSITPDELAALRAAEPRDWSVLGLVDSRTRRVTIRILDARCTERGSASDAVGSAALARAIERAAVTA